MLMAMQSMILAISAGFSDLRECDTDSFIVSHRLSVISGNILRQIVHHSWEDSSIISRSCGEGSICDNAEMRVFCLLYCALDTVG